MRNLLFVVLLSFTNIIYANCNIEIDNMKDGDSIKKAMRCLQIIINEINTSYKQSIDKLDQNNTELMRLLNDTSKWPHAINCGAAWGALFVLHGYPANDADPAWYVQVYPNEYRYVRFNADLSFLDRAGHSDSSIGCANKSISLLREEGRTYELIKK